MRLVLDTNVVASALLWGGTPRLLFDAARQKHVELFTSTPLVAELTDILNRRKFEKKIVASRFTIDQIMDGYLALAMLVKPQATLRIASDPDDDVVIGTGQAANADLIVSGDSHLIDLRAVQGHLHCYGGGRGRTHRLRAPVPRQPVYISRSNQRSSCPDDVWTTRWRDSHFQRRFCYHRISILGGSSSMVE